MEKIMIFSLFAWFGIMLTVAPQILKKEQPAQVVTRNEDVRANPVEKKHGIRESAILVHDPR
jgi:hypothetical protein